MFFRAAVAASVAYLFVLSARLAHDDGPAVARSAPPPAPMVVVVPAAATSTRVVDVRRADLEQAMKDPHAARLVPTLRDGKPEGVKLYAIRPGSALTAIGLENGDTLRSINDMPVAGAESALEAYARLESADHYDLDLVRKGERVRILVLVH